MSAGINQNQDQEIRVDQVLFTPLVWVSQRSNGQWIAEFDWTDSLQYGWDDLRHAEVWDRDPGGEEKLAPFVRAMDSIPTRSTLLLNPGKGNA